MRLSHKLRTGLIALTAIAGVELFDRGDGR